MLSSRYEWLSYIEDTPFWNVLFYFELLVLDFFYYWSVVANAVALTLKQRHADMYEEKVILRL